MDVQLGLSDLSVISWVSAIQGCLLSGVPLYPIMFNFTLYVCAENFPVMKIDVPASVGTPLLYTPAIHPHPTIPPSIFPLHDHKFLQQWIWLVRLAPAVNIGVAQDQTR